MNERPIDEQMERIYRLLRELANINATPFSNVLDELDEFHWAGERAEALCGELGLQEKKES